jgi:molecular chaperone DnaK
LAGTSGAGRSEGSSLLDDPLSLAIETLGGVATPMHPAQHDDSDQKTETTAGDSRPRLKFTCCRASGPWRRRTELGKFHLTDPPVARRAADRATFDIDANGILNVTAKDTATQKDQKITITSPDWRRKKSSAWRKKRRARG